MKRTTLPATGPPRSGESGFTYIELLIASTLLVVSLLALCGLFITGHSSVTSAGKTTMGLSAARQVMEEIKRTTELPLGYA